MLYDTQPIASHFINGAYVEDTSGTPIPVIYPATGETIDTIYAATPAFIEHALDAAKSAHTAWAAMSGTQRYVGKRRNRRRTVGDRWQTGRT